VRVHNLCSQTLQSIRPESDNRPSVDIIPFAQLKVNTGLDEYVVTLDVDCPSLVHILKLLGPLLVEDVKMVACGFLDTEHEVL